jgi:hypothetical protein
VFLLEIESTLLNEYIHKRINGLFGFWILFNNACRDIRERKVGESKARLVCIQAHAICMTFNGGRFFSLLISYFPLHSTLLKAGASKRVLYSRKELELISLSEKSYMMMMTMA